MHSGKMKAVGAAAVLLAALAGCGDSNEEASSAAGASASPIAASTAAPTASPAASATSQAEAGDCLVGEWKIPAKQLTGFYEAVMKHQGAPASPTGTGELSFTDEGRYRFAVEMAVSVEGVKMEIVGDVDGAYRSDGSTITTSKDKIDAKATADMGGQKMSMNQAAADLFPSSPLAKAPYTCTDGVPTIELDYTGTGAKRFPVTLQKK